MQITNKIKEVSGYTATTLPNALLQSSEPVVIRGMVGDWPLVKAGLKSDSDANQYLQGFYNGAAVTATHGKPEDKGFISYKPDMSGIMTHREQMRLDTVLDQIQAYAEEAAPPLIYITSTTIEYCLPGLGRENGLKLGERTPLESIWIGNRSRVPPHFDLPDNIACVAVGHRRFTLFPPEQLENLYVGPLDMTPGGQSVSLVDLHSPDLTRFPKYRKAMEVGQVAELAPGDAIFIPSMWWHEVEGLSDFNVLMNYWWRQSPAFMGPPADALTHALLTLRDLPAEQKKAWKGLFDHYVFENDEDTVAHIPEAVRGSLAPMDDDAARRIRSYLLNRLNR